MFSELLSRWVSLAPARPVWAYTWSAGPEGRVPRLPRAWGAKEDGERMRWAFTGVCASETVQTQEDGRCVTAPPLRTQEDGVGAERGARGASTGRSFSFTGEGLVGTAGDMSLKSLNQTPQGG